MSSTIARLLQRLLLCCKSSSTANVVEPVSQKETCVYHQDLKIDVDDALDVIEDASKVLDEITHSIHE